jgi:hypothetical protein
MRDEILADLLANSRSVPDKICEVEDLERHVATPQARTAHRADERLL